MRNIVLIAHNIRSTHNIGSLFRTCDGLGIDGLYLTGYTPYPLSTNDARLPHISNKLTAQIHKTALGAEETVSWHHTASLDDVFFTLKSDGYSIIALEQNEASVRLSDFQPPEKCAILIGEEVSGISTNLLNRCDDIVEIPMFGQKESFNVSVAAGIALYHFRLHA